MKLEVNKKLNLSSFKYLQQLLKNINIKEKLLTGMGGYEVYLHLTLHTI